MRKEVASWVEGKLFHRQVLSIIMTLLSNSTIAHRGTSCLFSRPIIRSYEGKG